MLAKFLVDQKFSVKRLKISNLKLCIKNKLIDCMINNIQLAINFICVLKI